MSGQDLTAGAVGEQDINERPDQRPPGEGPPVDAAAIPVGLLDEELQDAVEALIAPPELDPDRRPGPDLEQVR